MKKCHGPAAISSSDTLRSVDGAFIAGQWRQEISRQIVVGLEADHLRIIPRIIQVVTGTGVSSPTY